MGTRSAIGMRTVDGRITAIYCHWDGYPSYNGRVLQEHYSDGNKLAELIALGDISSLRPNIGSKHDFNARYEDTDPRNDWVVAYHRDRGEELNVRVYSDAQDFVDNFNSGEEYFYLWTGKEWLVNAYARKNSNGFPEFDRLEDVLVGEDA